MLAKIIPAMLDNVMKLAIDPLFPPPLSESLKNKHPFGSSFETNKMVLVYDSYFDEEKLIYDIFTQAFNSCCPIKYKLM